MTINLTAKEVEAIRRQIMEDNWIDDEEDRLPTGLCMLIWFSLGSVMWAGLIGAVYIMW